jgi:hypothetical protein
MPRLTYKRYINGGADLRDFSLSSRYQQSENYRSSKLLEQVIYILGITTLIAEIFYIIITIDLITCKGLREAFNTVIMITLISQVRQIKTLS